MPHSEMLLVEASTYTLMAIASLELLKF